MVKLADTPGIGQRAKELLDAVGYGTAPALAAADVAQLLAELKKANDVLRIMPKPPAKSTLTRWIREARKVSQAAAREAEAPEAPVKSRPAPATPREPDKEPTRLVNFEADPAVDEMLENAPVALPLPGRVFIDLGLGVSEIVSGILLTRAAGDLEISVEAKPPPKAPAGPRVQLESRPRLMVEISAPVRRGLDVTKLRTVTEVKAQQEEAVANEEQADQRTEHFHGDHLRGPREETNRGKSPSSRKFIRGVLHPQPWKLRIGALAALGCAFLVPLAVPAGVLLLLSDVVPEKFSWVPGWFLLFPAILPLFGVLYFTVGFSGKCRVCGQRVFVPRRCRRHAKAHHVRWIGHIVPTGLHLLLFQWFRCIFCGTPIRLKE